ncbi:MAG TPA: FAD-dependent oxidoreductase [Clostridiaceae bacterium]
MKFKSMFQPIKIGPMEVTNRFVVSPMGNNFANTDGTMSERSLAYYRERARGGFGLITFEATVVSPVAKGGAHKPCLYNDSTIESFKKVVDACHAEGAKISVQLQHAGPDGNAKVAGYPIKAASAIPSVYGKETPEAMTKEEIYQLIGYYGDAALRAKKAGIDCVEVHCAHGYLVSSFLSPRTNKRIDEFGGCFENRMRIVKLIIENIREKVGYSIAVICRINSADEVDGGLDVHDSAAIAAYMEDCGVDGLHVSRAVHIRDQFMWAPTVLHSGFNADQCTEIKRAVTIPVITVGRYTEPHFAELMVREGRADLVAFGRQSIADPHTPNKAAAGKLDELNPCIACLQGCVPNMYLGQPITCLVNPMVGHEGEVKPAGKAKKVMVVGGGVAGLYAAALAAQRGHDVTLYEAADTLGGQMRLAAFPPGKGELTNMVRSYVRKCEMYGVKVKMNTEVTPELVKAEAPDSVIICTGARPLVLNIPGIHDSGLIHAVDLLAGKDACGEKVLVVGGGMVGAETAAFLGEQHHDVTVVEMRDAVAPDVMSEHRIFLMKDFAEYGIKSVTGAAVAEFFEGGVSYKDVATGEIYRLDGFDSVVLAMGARNYDPISEEVKKIVPETYVIGDATKARKALDATKEAYDVVVNL